MRLIASAASRFDGFDGFDGFDVGIGRHPGQWVDWSIFLRSNGEVSRFSYTLGIYFLHRRLDLSYLTARPGEILLQAVISCRKLMS